MNKTFEAIIIGAGVIGAGGSGGVGVVVSEGAEGLPFVVWGASEQVDGAGFGSAFGDAGDEVGVAVDFAEVVILEDRFALAGG